MVFARCLTGILLFICSVASGQTARVAERRAVIESATRFAGIRETGNNRGKPAELFIVPYGYPPGTAWCGLFIHHVFTVAKVSHGVKGAALAANWSIPATAVISRYGKLTGSKVPVAGDVALFRFSHTRIDHVELILRWTMDDEDSYFFSIGGNTSNPANPKQEGVFIKKRSKREVYMVVNRID